MLIIQIKSKIDSPLSLASVKCDKTLMVSSSLEAVYQKKLGPNILDRQIGYGNLLLKDIKHCSNLRLCIYSSRFSL